MSDNQQPAAASYTYWVRETTVDAAPLPVPKKLSPSDLSNHRPSANLGSAWNAAGTWEEKNINAWAAERIKDLLTSINSLDFPNGKAEITEVSRCEGDASVVIVRNKKRVGYTYELRIKVKGEWLVRGEKRMVKGHLDIDEFSYGEVDDLQMTVKLTEDKDLKQQDKQTICQDLKQFLQPVREKLLQFEQELKDR